jgi:hypothetical protein
MDINKILAVPLKIPKLQPDSWENFWKVWERDARRYMRLAPDSAGNTGKVPGWTGFVWELHPLEVRKWQTMWDVTTNDYSNEFPEMRKIIDALPFKTFRVLFQSNYSEINEHRDGMNNTDHLPYACAVRFMFYDANTEPNFYFCKTLNGDRTYLKLPEETNAFVYNNPKLYHAAHYLGKFKIIAHLVIADIDEEKWFNILKDSATCYSEFCLMD